MFLRPIMGVPVGRFRAGVDRMRRDGEFDSSPLRSTSFLQAAGFSAKRRFVSSMSPKSVSPMEARIPPSFAACAVLCSLKYMSLNNVQPL